MEIQSLTLNTQMPGPLEVFYSKKLGFPISDSFENGFTIETGKTSLTFKKVADKPTNYHFAFQISENKIIEAKKWLISRGINLLTDEKTGNDIIMKKSIYFLDPDGNISEFIGREVNDTQEGFSINSIKKLNEIGLPVRNKHVMKVAMDLIRRFNINIRSPRDFDNTFCWVGNDHGVLIVVKEGRHWIPTKFPAIPSDFHISFRENDKIHSFKYINGIIVDQP